MDIKTIISGYTHIGFQRESNEDSVCVGNWSTEHSETDGIDLALSVDEPLCVAVADGIGGHVGGEVASAIVTECLSKHRWKDPIDQSIRTIIQVCERTIRDRMNENFLLKGMGSTVAGIVLLRRCFFHFNVGDSRIYSFVGNSLNSLSTDDVRKNSGALTQALGGTPGYLPSKINCHIGNSKLNKNDKLIACSDGLTDLISDSELEEILRSNPNISAKILIEHALNQGGLDNVTAVVVSRKN